MAEEINQKTEVSMKNTKQELLAAYNKLLKSIEEKQKKELKAVKETTERLQIAHEYEKTFSKNSLKGKEMF